jgi:hypothetical protein
MRPQRIQYEPRSVEGFGGTCAHLTGKNMIPIEDDKTNSLRRAIATKLTSPAEGIYSIHPRQMITRKPLNINDDDLIDGVVPVEKPLSYPTDMAYFLQRCSLAESSRHIVDRASLMMARTSEPNPEDLMDVDTELQMLINNMPNFFSMSEKQLIATYNFSPLRAAAVFQQGHIARFLIHAQRCRLHLRYFTRGFTDMDYAPSKEMCLRSARQVIQCDLQSVNATPANRYRFCALFIGVLMGSMVLFMDFCINRNSAHRENQRKDVAEAFRLLEGGRKESEPAARFVDSFMQILKKHNLPPPKTASIQQSQNERPNTHQIPTPPSDGMVLDSSIASICPSPFGCPTPSSGFTMDSSTNMTVNWMNDNVDLTSYFDDLSQDFEMGVDAENVNWDNIFTDFGSAIVGTP